MTPIRQPLSAHDFRRKIVNITMCALLLTMTFLAITPLFSVFIYVVKQGLPALSLGFFTDLPKPIGEIGGGVANAIVGTGILVGMASAVGVPIGIALGVYLSEYGTGKLAGSLRFAIDLLASIPSIIIGLFAYSMIVFYMKRFSAIAGSASLVILMIPTVARTTEELLKLVPVHIREAGLALGIPRWKVILMVVLRGSMGGIMTGVMLAIARAAGETAPLLLTALSSPYWPRSVDQPIASLPVQIYTYAISPYEDWHQKAWASALVLVVFVFVLNFVTRLAIQRQPVAKD